jgi:hypothetical protein
MGPAPRPPPVERLGARQGVAPRQIPVRLDLEVRATGLNGTPRYLAHRWDPADAPRRRSRGSTKGKKPNGNAGLVGGFPSTCPAEPRGNMLEGNDRPALVDIQARKCRDEGHGKTVGARRCGLGEPRPRALDSRKQPCGTPTGTRGAMMLRRHGPEDLSRAGAPGRRPVARLGGSSMRQSIAGREGRRASAHAPAPAKATCVTNLGGGRIRPRRTGNTNSTEQRQPPRFFLGWSRRPRTTRRVEVVNGQTRSRVDPSIFQGKRQALRAGRFESTFRWCKIGRPWPSPSREMVGHPSDLRGEKPKGATGGDSAATPGRQQRTRLRSKTLRSTAAPKRTGPVATRDGNAQKHGGTTRGYRPQ